MTLKIDYMTKTSVNYYNIFNTKKYKSIVIFEFSLYYYLIITFCLICDDNQV